MDGIVSRMINTQALLFLYMLCGAVVSRLNIIRPDNRQPLVRLLMDVAMPMMVLSAFNKQSSREEMLSSVWIILFSLTACLTAGALGLLLWKKQPENKRKVLQYATMFSNAGNAGLPIIQLVFGPTGVLYASMYLIPTRVLQWTLGISMFVKPEKGSWIRNVALNPMVMTVYIGLFIMLTGWQITGVAGTAITNLGNMTSPLVVILIGATLARMQWRTLLDPVILKVSLIRLFAIPLAAYLLLKALHAPQLLTHITVILLAMPAASNTAAMSERYGGDYVFASACVSVTTLLSVVTVPLVTWIIQMI